MFAVRRDDGLVGADGDIVELARLGFVKTEVGALFFHQRVVVADLDDLAAVEHDQPVGLEQRGQTVGDGDGGAAANEVFKGGLDFNFGFGIERRSGFVEDQDARIDSSARSMSSAVTPSFITVSMV